MGVDFEQEIRGIFGTTDLTALREISKAANEYQHMVEKSVRKQASGRKIHLRNRRLHVFLLCRVRERRLPVSRSSIRFHGRRFTARSSVHISLVMIRMCGCE